MASIKATGIPSSFWSFAAKKNALNATLSGLATRTLLSRSSFLFTFALAPIMTSAAATSSRPIRQYPRLPISCLQRLHPHRCGCAFFVCEYPPRSRYHLHIPAKKRPSSPARFCPILEMAAQCGVLKVGQVTVAIDGTKVLAKAAQADSTPLQDGLTIPDEVHGARNAKPHCFAPRWKWRREPVRDSKRKGPIRGKNGQTPSY